VGLVCVGQHIMGHSVNIQWHVQHIHVHLRFMSSIQSLKFNILGLMDLKYVLLAHTTERFLLLYGKVIL
jgi:hypothetical protein